MALWNFVVWQGDDVETPRILRPEQKEAVTLTYQPLFSLITSSQLARYTKAVMNTKHSVHARWIMNWKVFGRNQLCLNWGVILAFARRDEENIERKPIRIASFPDEIRASRSPNTTTRLRHYCLTSPRSIVGIVINFPQGS
jgi:hypothetical protein